MRIISPAEAFLIGAEYLPMVAFGIFLAVALAVILLTIPVQQVAALKYRVFG